MRFYLGFEKSKQKKMHSLVQALRHKAHLSRHPAEMPRFACACAHTLRFLWLIQAYIFLSVCSTCCYGSRTIRLLVLYSPTARKVAPWLVSVRRSPPGMNSIELQALEVLVAVQRGGGSTSSWIFLRDGCHVPSSYIHTSSIMMAASPQRKGDTWRWPWFTAAAAAGTTGLGLAAACGTCPPPARMLKT